MAKNTKADKIGKEIINLSFRKRPVKYINSDGKSKIIYPNH